MIGWVILSRTGMPSSSLNPRSTSRSASSGTTAPTLSLRPMSPFSTTCMAATAVTSLVREAILKTESVVTAGESEANDCFPRALEYSVLPEET